MERPQGCWPRRPPVCGNAISSHAEHLHNQVRNRSLLPNGFIHKGLATFGAMPLQASTRPLTRASPMGGLSGTFALRPRKPASSSASHPGVTGDIPDIVPGGQHKLMRVRRALDLLALIGMSPFPAAAFSNASLVGSARALRARHTFPPACQHRSQVPAFPLLEVMVVRAED